VRGPGQSASSGPGGFPDSPTGSGRTRLPGRPIHPTPRVEPVVERESLAWQQLLLNRWSTRCGCQSCSQRPRGAGVGTSQAGDINPLIDPIWLQLARNLSGSELAWAGSVTITKPALEASKLPSGVRSWLVRLRNGALASAVQRYRARQHSGGCGRGPSG